MKVEKTEIQHRIESFKSVAQKAGVKLTPQRLEIFAAVASSLEHPTAESVLKAVKARMPMLSLDTVYRTLWMLQDLGLISTLGSRHESVRFDANLVPHHHYICIHCGLVRDFESPELHQLPIPDSIHVFGSRVGTRVEVQGICRQCEQTHSSKKQD